METAVWPAGTSKRMSKLALSRGWSLDGRNRCAQLGCGAVAEPCVWKKNAVVEKSAEFASVGAAVKCETVTRNGRPLRSGSLGVITRSSGVRVNFAGRPLTDAADALAREVEVEARESLRGLGQDRDRAVNPCVGALVA